MTNMRDASSVLPLALAPSALFGETLTAQTPPAEAEIWCIVNDAKPWLGEPIAPGSVFLVEGRDIGEVATAGSFPLPTVLGGTSIQVRVGDTVVHAFLLSTQPGFVRALLPSTTPTGTGFVIVSHKGHNTKPWAITIARYAPGLYGGAAQNIGDSGAVETNSAARPVNRVRL